MKENIYDIRPEKWINFLHLYQPGFIRRDFIVEAIRKSYLRIFQILMKNPRVFFTFNISGCLLEIFGELGYKKLIKDIKILLDRGQIELTGTSAHHHILPLIKKEEVIYQIEEHENILKKFFGNSILEKIKGFYLPEMAYDENIASIIKEKGYQWIILDEIAVSKKKNSDNIFLDKKNNIKIILRSRILSKIYPPALIEKILFRKNSNDSSYIEILLKNNNIKNLPKNIITATDGELYGLHNHDSEKKFEKVMRSLNKDQQIETQTISNFIFGNKNYINTKINVCNGESSLSEIKEKNYFTLWKDPQNEIHQLLWKLANLAQKLINKNQNDENWFWARHHLNLGLTSCTFWWASSRDFRDLFGPLAWNPDIIETGSNQLIKAIRSLQNKNIRKYKIKAEDIYFDAKKLIWQNHWKNN